MAQPAKNTYYIEGTGGDDILHGNDRANQIWGLAGNDIIYLYGGDDRGVGNGGNDAIWGGNGNDWLQGQEGDDVIYGEAGIDDLWGMKGEDRLDGGSGNDILWGGADRDIMSGGSGADTFRYASFWESTTRVYDGTADGVTTAGVTADGTYDPNGDNTWDPEWMDVDGDDPTTPWLEDVDLITDFETGIDKIDLTRIDADLSTPIVSTRKGSTGNEAFRLVSEASGQAGELTVNFDPHSNLTTINGYVDADLIPDLTITVAGTINSTVDILF